MCIVVGCAHAHSSSRTSQCLKQQQHPGALHWSASGADLGVGGACYVEILILYDLWALVPEKAVSRCRRLGRPISVSAADLVTERGVKTLFLCMLLLVHADADIVSGEAGSQLGWRTWRVLKESPSKQENSSASCLSTWIG